MASGLELRTVYHEVDGGRRGDGVVLGKEFVAQQK